MSVDSIVVSLTTKSDYRIRDAAASRVAAHRRECQWNGLQGAGIFGSGLSWVPDPAAGETRLSGAAPMNGYMARGANVHQQTNRHAPAGHHPTSELAPRHRPPHAADLVQ
jgi:hypothetical protein